MLLFQYSNTEHSSIVSRTLQSKTSNWLDSKEKLFDLWNGLTKRSDAKGKRSAWGMFPPCPVKFHWYLCFVRSQEFQVRRFFWNMIKFRHRECLKQEAQIFSWMILALLQGHHSDGGFQNSVYHQTRSDSKTTQKRYIFNCVSIKEGQKEA